MEEYLGETGESLEKVKKDLRKGTAEHLQVAQKKNSSVCGTLESNSWSVLIILT